ncbi:MAG: PAS domain S-box protein [Acidobacteria bacterium]|nr:PAS domain S-box protein [Acidobacteriota bacterium]
MTLRLAAGTAAGYLLAAHLGYLFSIRPAGMVVAWPPAGLMLGLLLVHDRKRWPELLMSGIAGNIAADLWWGSRIEVALLAGLANSLETLAAAWVTTAVTGGTPSLRMAKHVGTIIFVAIVPNAMTAALGATVLMWGAGMHFWTGWFAWWTGDGMGQLLLVPAVLVVHEWLDRGRHGTRSALATAAPLLLLVAGISWLSMAFEPAEGSPLTANPYMIFPLLLWIAFSLGPPAAVAANVVVAGVTLWFGSQALGRFGAPGFSATDQVLQVWVFLVAVITTSLMTAAVLCERKAATEQLRLSETRLRQIAENIAEVFWIADAGLRKIHFVSWAYERVWGRSVETLYDDPKSFLASVHPEDLPRVRETFETLGDGVSFEHEYRVVRPDGTVRRVRDRGIPLPPEPGKTRQYVGFAQDITERHQAQAQAQLLAQAVESSSEFVSVTDLDDRFTFVNPAFCRTYGYSREELLGETPWLLQPAVSPPATAQDILDASRSSGWRGTVRNTCRDGREIVIDLNTSPIKAPDGHVLGLIGVGRDITEQTRLEGELRQAQKMEVVGMLAGGVAHDFNNLLTVILGYTQFLLDEPEVPPGWRADVTEVHDAAERAAALTRQLLGFGRRQVTQPRVVDMAAVVSGLIPMLTRLIGEHIAVQVEVDAEAAHPVFADPTQLEQVLLNLCVNARDAMPGGGVLSIRLTRQDADPARDQRSTDSVILAITDTGTGMDAATLARIFEPFYTTKETGKGTGLGLSTVYGIVKSLNGIIEVDSKVGHGTTFRVTVPAHAGGIQSAPPTTNEVAGGHERILIVEDELAIRQFAGHALERYGYTVYSAGSSAQALELFDDDSVDLLVTDIRLPGMSGLALAQALRERSPLLRVLFISGYSEYTHAGKDSALPGAFLAKPFDAKTLLAAVRTALN